MNVRSARKQSVALWATVVVVLALVAYPLSMGPMISLNARGTFPEPVDEVIRCIYRPLHWVARNPKVPKPVRRGLVRYAELWGWVL